MNSKKLFILIIVHSSLVCYTRCLVLLFELGCVCDKFGTNDTTLLVATHSPLPPLRNASFLDLFFIAPPILSFSHKHWSIRFLE